tara:strand:- start:80 stop:1567 length:1488 start_codon:yes stop_codon:yes gene_type:complete
MATNATLNKLIDQTRQFKLVTDKHNLPTGIKVEACVRKKGKTVFRKSQTFLYNMDGYHEALAWHREITDAVRTGRVINLIKAEGITVANAIKLCESDLKDGWHACKQYYVDDALKICGHFERHVGKDRNLNTITYEDLEAYVMELLKIRKGNTTKNKHAKPLTFRTINLRMTIIGKLFNLAYKRGYLKGKPEIPKLNQKKQPPIDKRPFRFIKDDKGNVVVNEEQDFYNECRKKGGVFNEFGMIVQLAINTGMREGELINTKISWIDFKAKRINIPANMTKAYKRREVALNPIAWAIVKYFVNGRKGNVKLLVSHYKAKLKREQMPINGDIGMFKWYATKIVNYFAEIKERMGVTDPRLTFHSTRHTAVSRLINNPIEKPSVFDVKEWIGHSEVQTTLNYWEQENNKNAELSDSMLMHPANLASVSNEEVLKAYALDNPKVELLEQFDNKGQWTRNPKWNDTKALAVAKANETKRRMKIVREANRPVIKIPSQYK